MGTELRIKSKTKIKLQFKHISGLISILHNGKKIHSKQSPGEFSYDLIVDEWDNLAIIAQDLKNGKTINSFVSLHLNNNTSPSWSNEYISNNCSSEEVKRNRCQKINVINFVPTNVKEDEDDEE